MGASVPPSDLAHAATTLVTTALHVREGERLVVIADGASLEIGQAVVQAGESAGAQVTLALLDHVQGMGMPHDSERPHKVLPEAIRRAMLAAQASVFLATAPHAELGTRDQLFYIVGACRIRHAHMPALSPRAFAFGMKMDYTRLESWGRAMERRVALAREFEVESAAGTKLRVTFPAEYRWTESLGVISPGQWAQLPAGALYAQPESVDGIFVANASMGEFFGAREGMLLQKPVKLFIERGRVRKVEAPFAPELVKDVEAMLAIAPNSNRVGLAVIGVNVGLEAPTGDAAVDQNLPGVHLVIGDPGGRIKASAWSARTSFFACAAGGRVDIDGSTAIDGGKVIRVA